MQTNNVILKPLLTEKTSVQTELRNRYAFKVNPKANKYQIKDAVEAMFNVKVVNVKTLNNPGKMKRIGRFISKTNGTKKAYVQIQEGQKIELFKGI
ncbi:50S ribosomal protein L23 [Bacteriovoracaceae bacterium]|nr:50S ribosomal protein L23 [Bacteriovoracaceae bacterium]